MDEADRLLRAAAPEWQPMLAIALRTGLRLGELLALRWSDVDLVASQLVVRRTLWQGEEGTPKGGRHRPVPLSDEAAATLKAHRHLRGSYVFCDEMGARLTHSFVKDVVPQACVRAGLAKRITWHGLRHSFASHLVMRGASLKAVQELLGHESIEMTRRYSHLTPDVRRATVRLLDTGRGDVGETQAGVQPERKPPATEVVTGGKLEREKGFEPVVSRAVSGTFAPLEKALEGPTRPPDASGRVATETVGYDTASSAHGLPLMTPDLFLAAGFIVADLASSSLAETSALEQVLRRAVHQASALRAQLRGRRTTESDTGGERA